MATASSQAKVDARMPRYQQTGSGNIVIPRASSGGIIPDVPLDSLVANLVARTEQANCGGMRRGQVIAGSGGARPMESVRSAPAGIASRKVSLPSSASVSATTGGSRKEDDYLWETDPNGGWLSSFP